MKHNLKIVYFGQKEQMESIANIATETFGNKIELKLSPEKYADGWFVTILHPKGDKSHGLKSVAKMVDVDLKSVTVFGDSINDIGMFELAGKSVAVANALDELKCVADVVLDRSNDEDAVGYFLDNIV